MRCPRCGASDCTERRDSDGRRYSYDYTCRGCSHHWWLRGGTTLGHALSQDRAGDASPITWVDCGRFAAAPEPVLHRDYVALADGLDLPIDYRRSGGAFAEVRCDHAAIYAAARGARLPMRHELGRLPGTFLDWAWAADDPVAHDEATIRLVRVDPTPPPVEDERGAELLAAIHADPAADGPRLVYADHLQQRGDMRGQFIALQMARAHGEEVTDRERQLWSGYAPRWFGALLGILCPTTIVVERGFLRSGRVLAGPARLATIGDPRWATVEELECDDDALIVQPHMRALRRLSADPRVLVQLAQRTGGALPITELVGPVRGTRQAPRRRWGLRFDDAYDEWTRIAQLGALSHVRSIEISTDYTASDHIVHRLFRTPLGKQLTCIEICASSDHALQQWIPALRRASPLERVRCRFDASSVAAVVLERVNGELAVRVEGTPGANELRALGNLADVGLQP